MAGGGAYLATHLQQLRAQAEANGEEVVVVSAGDMVGSSPLLSAAFHDEPTIELLSALGLEFSAAGEDEFGEGVAELKRLQRGGCHPVEGCYDADGFAGAAFRYLVANVVDKRTKLPIFLPADVRMIQGVPVGFVGISLRSTPSLVSTAGMQNVEFLDEAQTANLYALLARLAGVKSLVLLIHEGGQQGVASLQNPSACDSFTGPIAGIVSRLRPEYGIVVAGHTHAAYACALPNASGQSSLVTSTTAFGTMVTSIGFTIDKRSREFTALSAQNVVVTRVVTPDAATQAFVMEYKGRLAPIANRALGSVTADVTRAAGPSGESSLGSLIADAQLAFTASSGAQIAFVNQGGLRADLNYLPSGGEGMGVVTYGELFTTLPFNELLMTVTLTGAQLKDVLEQQFGPPFSRILQISSGFSYSYSVSAPLGNRISGMTLLGVPIDPAARYRVTLNGFLASGGDGFSALTLGTNRTNAAGVDIDAVIAYLAAHSPVAPPPQNRIMVVP